MIEEWVDIVGYEGLYQVSNLGRDKRLRSINCKNERIVAVDTNKWGYLRVTLSKDNKVKKYYVHRLVAEHFISFVPEPNKTIKDYVVNHIDENKENNRLDNLEFITQKSNLNYGDRSTKASKAKMKPVIGINTTNGLIVVYDSILEAKKSTSITNISACCRDVRKSAGGYYWRYYENKKC